MSSEKFRDQRRAELLWKAELLSGNASLPALVLNISETGAKISCPEFESKEKIPKLKIECQFVTGLPLLSLDGEAVWMRNGQLGLRFFELNKKQKFLLQNFLKYHLAKSV